MSRGSCATLRRLLAVALGAWLLQLPLQRAWLAGPEQRLPRLRASSYARAAGSRCISLRAVPLPRVAGGDLIEPRLDREGLEPLEELDLGMPVKQEIEDITLLMRECFERIFEEKQVKEESLGPFGGLAQYINQFKDAQETEEIGIGLAFRLDLSLQFPSLRRPTKTDETVAIVARLKGGGPLVAYMELCMLVADGRRPEDDSESPPRDGAVRQPYLSNLCVATAFRRQGLGRALLELAEDIVSFIWKEERIYLHIDAYEPSRKLYESAGYVEVSPTGADGVTHLFKELADVGEELYDDDDEEVEGSDEGDEDSEAGEKEPLALGPGKDDVVAS